MGVVGIDAIVCQGDRVCILLLLLFFIINNDGLKRTVHQRITKNKKYYYYLQMQKFGSVGPVKQVTNLVSPNCRNITTSGRWVFVHLFFIF